MAESMKQRLVRHITLSGPLQLAEYMHWCMADAKDGYYRSKTSIGGNGDFITAPEVSQMFGELIGIWLVDAWKAIGSPAGFNLIELGPGRGTLMKDILRAATVCEEFLQAARIILIETSAKLRDHQREALSEIDKVEWLSDFQNAADRPTLLVANEFLDVLPIRQYVKSNGKWHENAVGLSGKNLGWVLESGTFPIDGLPSGHDLEPEGAVFEISNAREVVIEQIAEYLSRNGGAALFIDYGHIHSGFGDTFQAVINHQYADPLEFPGESDLTSHVDFEPLSKIAARHECHVHPLMTQGEFLLSMGLLERAGQLGARKSPDTQSRITREAERLALPDQMGDLFKIFSFSTCRELAPFSNNT